MEEGLCTEEGQEVKHLVSAAGKPPAGGEVEVRPGSGGGVFQRVIALIVHPNAAHYHVVRLHVAWTQRE